MLIQPTFLQLSSSDLYSQLIVVDFPASCRPTCARGFACARGDACAGKRLDAPGASGPRGAGSRSWSVAENTAGSPRQPRRCTSCRGRACWRRPRCSTLGCTRASPFWKDGIDELVGINREPPGALAQQFESVKLGEAVLVEDVLDPFPLGVG